MSIRILWIMGFLSAAGNLYWLAAPAEPLFRTNPQKRAGAVEGRGLSGEDSRKLTARVLAAPAAAGNWQDLVARLRDAGYSEAFIRSLTDGALQHKYGVNEHDGTVWRTEHYWEEGFEDGTRDAPRAAQYAREAEELVSALDPSGPAKTPHPPKHYAVPEGKNPAVLKVMADYGELYEAIRRRTTRDRRLQSDEDALVLLDGEKAGDLAALLTPDELLELKLRESADSHHLRDDLALMKPTEREFRAIFQAQDTLGSRLRELSADDPRRPAEEAALQAQLKTVLGESRYEDYRLSRDEDFQSLSRLAQRLELPDGTAKELYALRTALVSQAEALRVQPSIDPAYRDRQLALMAGNVGAALKARLGPAGYALYLKAGGEWLQALSATGEKR